MSYRLSMGGCLLLVEINFVLFVDVSDEIVHNIFAIFETVVHSLYGLSFHQTIRVKIVYNILWMCVLPGKGLTLLEMGEVYKKGRVGRINSKREGVRYTIVLSSRR